MKKRIKLTVKKEIPDYAKVLAKSQGVSLSELFSRKIEALEDEIFVRQRAAKLLLKRMKDQPSL